MHVCSSYEKEDALFWPVDKCCRLRCITSESRDLRAFIYKAHSSFALTTRRGTVYGQIFEVISGHVPRVCVKEVKFFVTAMALVNDNCGQFV